MFKQGIPLAAFEVDDIEVEANRLKKHGVKFTTDPKQQGAGEARDFFRYLRQSDPDVPAASEESLIVDSALVGFCCRKFSQTDVGATVHTASRVMDLAGLD